MQNKDKINILAIVGPTASGKSGLAVSLAKKYNAEILSFDSMQLYRGMDIATAKPTENEMQGVPHHMISAVDNDRAFSVADYKEVADRIILDIHERGKNIIMVGGTGLYLDTVLSNIEFLPNSNDPKIRKELKKQLEIKGPQYMYKKLETIDKASAEQIHPNNTGRVIRALEVFYTTGRTMSYQVEESKKKGANYNVLYLGLTAKDREFIYDRINKRVDAMLNLGLLEEAEDFVSSPPGTTAKQAIGLKELAPYIRGEKSLQDCVDSLKQETRRYAKRQLTWFRRNSDINWLNIDELTALELVDKSVEIIDNSGIFKEE